VLVVSGSAHPATRAQLAHAAVATGLTTTTVDLADPATSGADVARRLQAGGVAALVAPAGDVSGRGVAVVDAMAAAAATALTQAPPRAVLLIGGETAFAVLAKLGHPRLRIDGPPPAPLVALTRILEGSAAGTPLITKGGSSGPPDRLSSLLEEAGR
jgi:uncharacterized protein YgbK (DUF1537 family)